LLRYTCSKKVGNGLIAVDVMITIFGEFSAKKIAVFSKTNVTINALKKKLSVVRAKNANFLPNY
jgi:hypothetical protein